MVPNGLTRSNFKLRFSALLILGACVFIGTALTSCSWMRPNRVVQVHKHVSYANDLRAKPVKLRKKDLNQLKTLCLPKYNYWCLKTPGNDQWRGQVGQDLAGHAVFKDPAFAARAFTRVMRTYHFKHKLRTSREIISRYAPSSDCIGSKAYCPDDSRYLYGIKDLPYGKIGSQWVQYSTQQYAGFTEGGNCLVQLMYCPRGFNPTDDYAAAIGRAVGKGIDEDLELFDAQGTINLKVAVPLFEAFAKWELGATYKVDRSLIIRGAWMERRDFNQQQRKRRKT